jgi:truncated hemoglobin YjbI
VAPDCHRTRRSVRRQGRLVLKLRPGLAPGKELGDDRTLEAAHRRLRITPAAFDEVAAELGRTLDHFGVAPAEKDAVLGASAAHKAEVTERATAASGV